MQVDTLLRILEGNWDRYYDTDLLYYLLFITFLIITLYRLQWSLNGRFSSLGNLWNYMKFFFWIFWNFHFYKFSNFHMTQLYDTVSDYNFIFISYMTFFHIWHRNIFIIFTFSRYNMYDILFLFIFHFSNYITFTTFYF